MRMMFGVISVVLVSQAAAAAPTFNKDVAPILFQNCVSCHRPGEVAPFSLLTYKDAKKRAADLASVTESRLMPPWKAEKGIHDFRSERRLSEAQIKTIAAWAEGGTPEGDAKDLPATPKFTEGWQLGEPDVVVKMSEAYTVPAEGRDVFRVFVIPLNVNEERFVRAVEYRPSNRKVVHHALFFLDTRGEARRLDAADPKPGYGRMGGVGFTPSGGLGGWAPGLQPQPLPDGVGRRLPNGADLVLQVHFSPSGKEEIEQSTLGIYFTKTPPKKVLRTFTVGSVFINIPAGEKDYVVRQAVTAPVAAEIYGVTPHAHLLCREMKVWMTRPGGQREDLIWIKDWDFNWQEQYLFKEPIRIPAGTTVEMEYHYDNSAANPRNPSHPPKRVTFGEQTTSEMAFAFLQVVPEGGGSMNPRGTAVREALERLRARGEQEAESGAGGK